MVLEKEVVIAIILTLFSAYVGFVVHLLKRRLVKNDLVEERVNKVEERISRIESTALTTETVRLILSELNRGIELKVADLSARVDSNNKILETISFNLLQDRKSNK